MANQIVVKHRSSDTGEPSALLAGEIAANINPSGRKLYIGTGTGNIVFPDLTYVDSTFQLAGNYAKTDAANTFAGLQTFSNTGINFTADSFKIEYTTGAKISSATNIELISIGLDVKSAGGKYSYTSDPNSAVTLYYDGLPKFSTTPTGISTTGELVANNGVGIGNVDARITYDTPNNILKIATDQYNASTHIIGSDIRIMGDNLGTPFTKAAFGDLASALFYNGNDRIATTANGAYITGSLDVSDAATTRSNLGLAGNYAAYDVANTWTAKQTFSVGPKLNDNIALEFGDDSSQNAYGKIYADTSTGSVTLEQVYGFGSLRLKSPQYTSVDVINSNGSDLRARFQDDAIYFYSNGQQLLGIGGTGIYVTGNIAVSDADTTRSNLGLAIGTDVQAYDVDTAKLDVNQSWSGDQEFLGKISFGTTGYIEESYVKMVPSLAIEGTSAAVIGPYIPTIAVPQRGYYGLYFDTEADAGSIVNDYATNFSVATAPVGQTSSQVLAFRINSDQTSEFFDNVSITGSLDVTDAATTRSNLGLGSLATLSSIGTAQFAASALVTEAEGLNSSDNDTSIPTTAAVKNYVDSAVSGGVNYQGSYNATTNTPDLDVSPSGIKKGFMYTVTTAVPANNEFFGSIGLEVGDVLIAEIDNPTLASDWTIVQRNIVNDQLIDGGTY